MTPAETTRSTDTPPSLAAELRGSALLFGMAIAVVSTAVLGAQALHAVFG